MTAFRARAKMKKSLNLDLVEFHVREAMQEADAQFDRTEKFPRPRGAIGWFARFWPKSFAQAHRLESANLINYP